jgi:hypothetical protein
MDTEDGGAQEIFRENASHRDATTGIFLFVVAAL